MLNPLNHPTPIGQNSDLVGIPVPAGQAPNRTATFTRLLTEAAKVFDESTNEAPDATTGNAANSPYLQNFLIQGQKVNTSALQELHVGAQTYNGSALNIPSNEPVSVCFV